MIKYTTDHEWIRVEGDVGTVGITAFAQEKLGDLVFVELPAVGANYDKGQTACTVESVKAAADVFAPVGGEIVAANDKVTAEPGLVNTSPTRRRLAVQAAHPQCRRARRTDGRRGLRRAGEVTVQGLARARSRILAPHQHVSGDMLALNPQRASAFCSCL